MLATCGLVRLTSYQLDVGMSSIKMAYKAHKLEGTVAAIHNR